jgi:hypothetical protein
MGKWVDYSSSNLHKYCLGNRCLLESPVPLASKKVGTKHLRKCRALPQTSSHVYLLTITTGGKEEAVHHSRSSGCPCSESSISHPPRLVRILQPAPLLPSQPHSPSEEKITNASSCLTISFSYKDCRESARFLTCITRQFIKILSPGRRVMR